ncbi:MAG: amidohydrolase family protein [Anaerolineae bacterium]
MDLFDANCFVGRWTTEGIGCADTSALAQEMGRLGISRALVRHTWGWEHDPAVGNAELLVVLAGHPNLTPCLAAGPLVAEEFGGLEALLRQITGAGAAAVCLYPKSHSYSTAPWCSGTLLDALQAASVPVLLELSETSWPEVAGILDDWPRLPLIIVKAGYRILRNLLPLMRRHDTLHVDTSYLGDNEALEVVAREVGAERVLFGSGTPRTDGAGSLARLSYSALNDREKELVAGGNLQRLIAGIRLAA